MNFEVVNDNKLRYPQETVDKLYEAVNIIDAADINMKEYDASRIAYMQAKAQIKGLGLSISEQDIINISDFLPSEEKFQNAVSHGTPSSMAKLVYDFMSGYENALYIDKLARGIEQNAELPSFDELMNEIKDLPGSLGGNNECDRQNDWDVIR